MNLHTTIYSDGADAPIPDAEFRRGVRTSWSESDPETGSHPSPESRQPIQNPSFVPADGLDCPRYTQAVGDLLGKMARSTQSDGQIGRCERIWQISGKKIEQCFGTTKLRGTSNRHQTPFLDHKSATPPTLLGIGPANLLFLN
jgi:hypothetical protein